MSNSKWVRLIGVLVNNWFEIKECLVKPIWNDAAPSHRLIIDEHTTYGVDYYASAMESMVVGNRGGWYAYKEIEWLDFPKMVVTKEGVPPITQDLEAIKAVIDKAGQFTTELTQDELRLYAYYK